jgi:acyl-CoA thioesterase-1
MGHARGFQKRNRKVSGGVLSLAAVCLTLAACSSNSAEPSARATDATSPRASEAPAVATKPAAPAAPDNRKVLVVFGDSLAAGYGLDEGLSFPDDLQKKLDLEKLPWHVVNLGISGDTTEGGAARIDSATLLKPSIVLLELGGNDGLRGLPLAVTRKNLETMIQAFQGVGAKVVLAGITLPPNYGPDYVVKFTQIYKDLAAKYHLTFMPFLLADIITKDLHYFQRDGIHPTADGAQIVAGSVFKVVEPLLR